MMRANELSSLPASGDGFVRSLDVREMICLCPLGVTESRGRKSALVVRFTNNVVVILACGVRQRKLLRSAAPHALANSASLVE